MRFTDVMVAHAPSIRAVPFDHEWPTGVATELLTERQREHLAEIATLRFVPARTIIYRERTPADAVFIVSRGVIKSYRELRNGVQRITAFLFPSDVFGLAEGGRYVNTLEAVTPATLYSIPIPVLKESFRQDFALHFHFLCKVTHVLRESQHRMIGLARRDAPGKLALFLESMKGNRACGEGNGNGDGIWIPMSRTDIASYLGLTQEALSRAAARLQRQGIVKFADRRHVLITDPLRLKALADPV